MTNQDVPQPPAALTQPNEYAWGDRVAARDERMARHVTGALRDRYGHAREQHYVADAASLDGLQADHAGRLGTGWTPFDLGGAIGPGEHGYGFASGRSAIVVTWLDPEPGGKVPVTVFTFDDMKRR